MWVKAATLPLTVRRLARTYSTHTHTHTHKYIYFIDSLTCCRFDTPTVKSYSCYTTCKTRVCYTFICTKECT